MTVVASKPASRKLPIQIILHPTDFSEHSEYAFQMACALAHDYGARLIVLHIPSAPFVTPGELEKALPALRPELEKQLRRLQPDDPQTKVDYLLVEGEPAVTIVTQALATKTNLIVMGTHGRRGLTHLLMGSVAEQVLRKSLVPVLTVRYGHPM